MRAVMRSAVATTALTAVAIAATAMACTSAHAARTSNLSNYMDQKPDWQKCTGSAAPNVNNDPSTYAKAQCATVKVPLDYTDTGGDQIKLALIRYPATDQAHRLGSLVFNFGGPGESGIDTLPGYGDLFAHLGTRYDLVSFDPRGIGRSDPVTCYDDSGTLKFLYTPSPPQSRAEIDNLITAQQDYAKTCDKNSAKVLPHVGTINAARDLDVMRSALGDKKLNYLGFSYGTKLGAIYAHTFPTHVGRMTLDAVEEPYQTAQEAAFGQAGGFEKAVDDYLADCVAKGSSTGGAACPLGTTAAAAASKLSSIFAGARTNPVTTKFGIPLNETMAISGVTAALYDKQEWPDLTKALTSVLQGDGTTLLGFALQEAGMDQNGHFDNSGAANSAVSCADSSDRPTPDQISALQPRVREQAPVLGTAVLWADMLSCLDWPVGGDDVGKNIAATGSGPILVVGNTGDPATPYADAPKVAQQLGAGVGILITNHGEGHGAYRIPTATCVRSIVDDYFFTGNHPAGGTQCSS